MDKEDIKKKAEEGELALNDWFSRNNLPYVYLNQDPSTFSQLFFGNIKRPDFFLALAGVGMIAIDVKNKTKSRDEYTLGVENDLRKTIAFERVFRLPVWYVYKGESDHTWYWISALKALEVGDLRQANDTKEQFVAIKTLHFLELTSKDDLGKLYTQNLPGLTRIAALPET